MPQIYIQYCKDEKSTIAIQKKLDGDNCFILLLVGVRLVV